MDSRNDTDLTTKRCIFVPEPDGSIHALLVTASLIPNGCCDLSRLPESFTARMAQLASQSSVNGILYDEEGERLGTKVLGQCPPVPWWVKIDENSEGIERYPSVLPLPDQCPDDVRRTFATEATEFMDTSVQQIFRHLWSQTSKLLIPIPKIALEIAELGWKREKELAEPARKKPRSGPALFRNTAPRKQKRSTTEPSTPPMLALPEAQSPCETPPMVPGTPTAAALPDGEQPQVDGAQLPGPPTKRRRIASRRAAMSSDFVALQPTPLP